MKGTFVFLLMFGLLIVFSGQSVFAGNEDAPFKWGGFFSYSWMRDADGDGIPNGIDPDWYAPQDGSGSKDAHKHQHMHKPWSDTGTDDGVAGGGNGSDNGDRLHTQDQLREKLQDGSCLPDGN